MNVSIPTLYYPFTLQTNQYADVLEEYALQWVLRFNLVEDELAKERFLKAKFHLMAPICHPDCELEELKIAMDWLSLMMTWDIKCETSDIIKQLEVLGSLHKRFIEILNGAEVRNDDVSRSYAFHDLRKRILQRGGAKWLPSFTQAVERYFYGCLKEATNIRDESEPDIDTYIILRRLTGAMDPFLELIEFCDHLMLPDSLRENDFFKKIMLLANDIGCLCNDIFSAPKEMASGEVHNVVLILHRQHQQPLEQAFKYAIEMHDQKVKELINLEAIFQTEENTEITKYMSRLNTWLLGHYTWYFRTDRYQNVENLELVKA